MILTFYVYLFSLFASAEQLVEMIKYKYKEPIIVFEQYNVI